MRHTTSSVASNPWLTALSAAIALAASGCAEDLEFSPWVEPEQTEAIVTQDNGDGSFTSRVRAEEPETWVYFDFQSRGEARAADGGAAAWDLAFCRFHAQSNGGVNGAGGVRAAPLPGANFDALERAPASGYVEDAADGDDEGSDPDTVLEAGDGWYAYDPSTHTLSPRDVVYVIESAEGEYFKLQMLGYYDASGNDARPSFRWAPVLPPGVDPKP